MSFDTKVIDLSGGPVDLVADTDIAAAIAAGGANGHGLYLQNVGTSVVRFREGAAKPNVADKGHCLSPKDAAVLVFRLNDPVAAWVWTSATTGYVAVSAAI